MSDDLSILEAVEECLANGYGFEGELVPDRIRDGFIEATLYRPGQNYTDGGVSLRIRVEVVEP